MTEDIINALLAALESRLPALLALMWAAQDATDAAREITVPLVPPALYLYGRHLNDPTEFPAIVVWDEETDVSTSGTTYGSGGGAHSSDEMTHSIVVAAVLESDDEEVLERQLARYRAAIWRLLKENDPIGANGKSYVVTPVRGGRDSRAGNVRLISDLRRGVLWDVEVYTQEIF